MNVKSNDEYNWQYVSVGGVVRVRIDSGEAIARLGELDQKKWTVLSCPVEGLEFDSKTLSLLDTDGDGKIKVAEVVAAAEWLTSVIKDKDLILKGDSTLPLAQIDTDNPEGRRLYDSARQILSNLGLDKDEISIEDTSDSVAIFAGTPLNGDGIIIPKSTDDERLGKTISDIISCLGAKTDRSGEPGVDAESVERFYALCADYSAWKAASLSEGVLPYGERTGATLEACNAIKDKVDDFFLRCSLLRFDQGVYDSVSVSVDNIDDIASCPLARPSADGVLPFDAINPAWSRPFADFKALVLDAGFKGKSGITEQEWKAVMAGLGPYIAWLDSKKGAEVEPLGIEEVNAVLKEDRKAELLDLIARDAALKEESESIDDADKLMHYYRDFYRLLNNYVIFGDFYGRNGEPRAMFEAGRLYIDERCCNLCLRVSGTGNHAEAAALSGMFLIYCKCTSRKLGKTQDIVAVMTDGGVKNLRPGKNAIFYDLDGNDWDAVVTKIVDNPISIKQAFWSPYRKLAAFVSDKLDKSASSKDSEVTSGLIEKAQNVGSDPTKKEPFDIGKFAGVFAALGMAFAGIGVALKSLVKGLVALSFAQFVGVVAGVMLVISGPACFIAWRKLRKRNLGPVLNASGWAINSTVLINILFGRTLTSVAKYPLVKSPDPFKQKVPAWKKVVSLLFLLLVIAAVVLYFMGYLECIGLPFPIDC